MSERVETYWALVEGYAQVVARDGSLLTVQPRDAQDSVVIDCAGVVRRWPIDPWGRVTIEVPTMEDALVSMMLAFPGATMEVLS